MNSVAGTDTESSCLRLAWASSSSCSWASTFAAVVAEQLAIECWRGAWKR